MKLIALLAVPALAAGLSTALLAADEPSTPESVTPSTGLPAEPHFAERLQAVMQPAQSAQLEADRAQLEAQRAQYEVAQRMQALALDQQNASRALFDGGTPFVYTASGGPESRSLYISASETDPKAVAAAEEDLNIMARILTKALSGSGGNDEKKAMGIPITLTGGDTRNLEIEGYGALFLLHVNFPLSGPPAEPSAEKPKDATNSTWEEAKQEIYGSRTSAVRVGSSRMKFDPKRIDALKDDLLSGLKNGNNIRALKDGEFVTVVVNSEDNSPKPVMQFQSRLKKLSDSGSGSTGGSGGSGGFGAISSGGGATTITTEGGESWRIANAPAPAVAALRGKPASHAGSTLTIRVKKTDIDAFAKGKLSLDDFRKRASIALY